MKFIITVDVEADNQWKRSDNLTLKNMEFLPRFQALCEKYDFVLTYLVAYEVASDENSVKILKSWQEGGRAEIGAHLHPWTNPPFSEWELADPSLNTFPSELDENELRNKLAYLTDIITKQFGKAPTSYRAGRWGFDHRSVRILENLGYLVDCSVTPKINWSKKRGRADGSGGPDFRKASVSPYALSFENILETGESKILEVPMTILYRGCLVKDASHMANWFTDFRNGVTKRLLNKILFNLTWCRVLPNTKFKHLKGLHRSALKNQLPVLEFMIHSSELMPGGSPYNKTESDVERVYDLLEKFFKYLKQNNVAGLSLTEYARQNKLKQN